MTITLKHQDCMQYLKTLADESVDLICVDPPYFEIIADAWDNQWKDRTLTLSGAANGPKSAFEF